MHSPTRVKNPELTELQAHLEDMRVNNLHISNLLQVALPEICDEQQSLIAAAISYANADHEIWQAVSKIANAQLPIQRAGGES